MAEISPLAIVEQGAQVADDARVGPFTYIGPQVRIGAGCVIENNVTVTGRTTLLEGNHVFPMAVIGACDGEEGAAAECVMGQANAIREHVTIYGGRDRATRIGNDNLVMIACQVGPGATLGNHGVLDNCTQIGAGAVLEDYVRTSAFASIEAGVTVGEYTFVAGYAVIDHDAPPFAIVQGFPFRVRGANTPGLKRHGFGDDDIRALKAALRELYNGSEGYPDDEALRRLAGDGTAGAQVRLLVEALRRSAAKAGRGAGDG